MTGTGRLRVDPLFVGLTRPPMFLGVSYSFVIFYAIFCILYFIQTADFKVVFVGAGIHLIGYLICFKEPLFVELYLVRAQKCTKCKNKLYHGANSYDLC